MALTDGIVHVDLDSLGPLRSVHWFDNICDS